MRFSVREACLWKLSSCLTIHLMQPVDLIRFANLVLPPTIRLLAMRRRPPTNIHRLHFLMESFHRDLPWHMSPRHFLTASRHMLRMDGCHSASATFEVAWSLLPAVEADHLVVAMMTIFLEGEGSTQISTPIAISVTADDRAQEADLPVQAPFLANLMPADNTQGVTHGEIEAPAAVEVGLRHVDAAMSLIIVDADVLAPRVQIANPA